MERCLCLCTCIFIITITTCRVVTTCAVVDCLVLVCASACFILVNVEVIVEAPCRSSCRTTWSIIVLVVIWYCSVIFIITCVAIVDVFTAVVNSSQLPSYWWQESHRETKAC